MIDNYLLNHLVVVAKHLHFGNASRELGISQPTLSKSIQRLETALGAQLLDRSRKHVRLTPIGELVIQRAKGIIADSRDLERDVKLMLGGDLGSLLVGIGPGMSETYVSSAIAGTAEQHPAARIRVITQHWSELTKLLIDKKIDIFIADVTELMADERVQIIRLPAEPLIWFCRSEHPLACSRRVTRQDLLRYPIASPKMPPWAVEWFIAADPNREKCISGTYSSIECESYSTLKRMVLTSNCISAGLEATIEHELRSGKLVKLRIKSPELKTNAGIVVLKERITSPLAELTIQGIIKAANPNPRARQDNKLPRCSK